MTKTAAATTMTMTTTTTTVMMRTTTTTTTTEIRQPRIFEERRTTVNLHLNRYGNGFGKLFESTDRAMLKPHMYRAMLKLEVYNNLHR